MAFASNNSKNCFQRMAFRCCFLCPRLLHTTTHSQKTTTLTPPSGCWQAMEQTNKHLRSAKTVPVPLAKGIPAHVHRHTSHPTYPHLELPSHILNCPHINITHCCTPTHKHHCTHHTSLHIPLVTAAHSHRPPSQQESHPQEAKQSPEGNGLRVNHLHLRHQLDEQPGHSRRRPHRLTLRVEW